MNFHIRPHKFTLPGHRCLSFFNTSHKFARRHVCRRSDWPRRSSETISVRTSFLHKSPLLNFPALRLPFKFLHKLPGWPRPHVRHRRSPVRRDSAPIKRGIATVKRNSPVNRNSACSGLTARAESFTTRKISRTSGELAWVAAELLLPRQTGLRIRFALLRTIAWRLTHIRARCALRHRGHHTVPPLLKLSLLIHARRRRHAATESGDARFTIFRLRAKIHTFLG